MAFSFCLQSYNIPLTYPKKALLNVLRQHKKKRCTSSSEVHPL